MKLILLTIFLFFLQCNCKTFNVSNESELTAAISQIAEGDVVNIFDGTYFGDVIKSKNGTSTYVVKKNQRPTSNQIVKRYTFRNFAQDSCCGFGLWGCCPLCNPGGVYYPCP